MTPRYRIAAFLSATCFVANLAWAGTPTPPPVPPKPPTPGPQTPTTPVWAGLTLCEYRASGEICCWGRVAGLGTEDVVIRVDAASYCPGKVVPISGTVTVKPTKDALAFTDVCTVPFTTMDCPVVADAVLVTIEQPAASVVLQGYGFIFP